MRYALLSVFDKTGIVEFAQNLNKYGYKIISTGGTAKSLREAGVSILPIEEITGNPESFNGRMKTISFQVESGILYDRSNPKHQKEAKKLGIIPIDIVVCNLYPFEQTVAQGGSFDEIVENIDVGGPTMIRSGAKNHKSVLVVTDINDYPLVVDALSKGEVSGALRKKLATKAFEHLTFYDSQIARFLRGSKTSLPEEITLAGRKLQDLRYGENPHQRGAIYIEPNTKAPLAKLKKLAGRDLSLINVTDINAGLETVSLFSEPAAVVIKHGSPCGIALGKDAKQALERAIDADPESAFGGIIVLNKPITLEVAEVITSFKHEKRGNIDIVASPKFETDAHAILAKLRKSMGLYTFGKIPVKQTAPNIKWINGGFIVQEADIWQDNLLKDWEVVTKHKPGKAEWKHLQTAWKFVMRIKSNSIIIVDKKLPMTRGIGSGQTSRVRSTKIAISQAGIHAKGAILVSDSFFPFDDSVKLAAKAGIRLIIQQGGSINDQASIDAANQAGLIMIFTGRRAFWH